MPNINEFLSQPEKIFSPELEKIDGAKPAQNVIRILTFITGMQLI
jgi:hypothetical protein